jgi:hypothetical protein
MPQEEPAITREQPVLIGQETAVESNEYYAFSKLHQIPYLEEKAQEAVLVLKMNTTVLGELKDHYSYVACHANFPADLKTECHADLERFQRCVSGVEKDLCLLQSRTETLLSLLASRKSLVSLTFEDMDG